MVSIRLRPGKVEFTRKNAKARPRITEIIVAKQATRRLNHKGNQSIDPITSIINVRLYPDTIRSAADSGPN